MPWHSAILIDHLPTMHTIQNCLSIKIVSPCIVYFHLFFFCNLRTFGLKSLTICCVFLAFFLSCVLWCWSLFALLYSCWSKIVCLCALLSMSVCLTRRVFQELIQVGTILCIWRITDLQHIKTRTLKCAYRFRAWCWISLTVSSAQKCQVICPSGILVSSLCFLFFHLSRSLLPYWFKE